MHTNAELALPEKFRGVSLNTAPPEAKGRETPRQREPSLASPQQQQVPERCRWSPSSYTKPPGTRSERRPRASPDLSGGQATQGSPTPGDSPKASGRSRGESAMLLLDERVGRGMPGAASEGSGPARKEARSETEQGGGRHLPPPGPAQTRRGWAERGARSIAQAGIQPKPPPPPLARHGS